MQQLNKVCCILLLIGCATWLWCYGWEAVSFFLFLLRPMNKKNKPGFNVTKYIECYINPRREDVQAYKNIVIYNRTHPGGGPPAPRHVYYHRSHKTVFKLKVDTVYKL